VAGAASKAQVDQPLPSVDREAADRLAKEKSAREKSEREAKAKALAEQRERDAAKRAAEQEAERKRVEVQRLSEPVPPPVPPAAPALAAQPTTQTKSVKEVCARGNIISNSICESRICSRDPTRANDPICKQLKLDDEARKQRQFQ
jgi:hypothetical protein